MQDPDVNEIARRFETASKEVDLVRESGGELNKDTVIPYFSAVADFIDFGLGGELWNPRVNVQSMEATIPPLGERLPYGTQMSVSPFPNDNGDGGLIFVRYTKGNNDSMGAGTMLLEFRLRPDGGNALIRCDNKSELPMDSTMLAMGEFGLGLAAQKLG